VEFTEEDNELELDLKFKKELLKELDVCNKEYEYNIKCINMCAEIRSYLDEHALSNVIFKDLCVDNIKLLLSEIYS
tara:strand:+ start:181 stop:408 length:228 start_codon:yes stop_codon:yes gene_type:complete